MIPVMSTDQLTTTISVTAQMSSTVPVTNTLAVLPDGVPQSILISASNIDQGQVFSLMAQINVGFLGIVITLVALLPTLIGLAESFRGELLAEIMRRRILDGLRPLRYSLWLFGSTIVLSVIGVFLEGAWSLILLVFVVVLSVFGFVVVVVAGASLANTSAEIMATRKKK